MRRTKRTIPAALEAYEAKQRAARLMVAELGDGRATLALADLVEHAAESMVYGITWREVDEVERIAGGLAIALSMRAKASAAPLAI